MRPSLPFMPHAAMPENAGWGLAFQAVNSIALTVVTSKVLFDMLRDRKHTQQKAHVTDENLGPLVRREIERALAAHDGHRGRGG
jgi:hypothetical protein